MAHHATVLRLSEELRLTEGESIVAVLYDQLKRQQWAKRAAQKDPRLSIDEEASKIDEQVLLAARTRLELITKGGMRQTTDRTATSSAGLSSQGSYPAPALAAESALAKSVSAAQTITKRAEQAAKAMAAHQTELNKRGRAMLNDKPKYDDKKGDGKGRHWKRQQWWDKMHEESKRRKGGRH